MHAPLIDDFTPADDLDALAADLELGADQLALYRVMQQGLSTHRVNRMMQQYRATRNRAKRGGKQNNAARPVPF